MARSEDEGDESHVAKDFAERRRGEHRARVHRTVTARVRTRTPASRQRASASQ